MSINNCPQCGYELLPGIELCPNCGYSINFTQNNIKSEQNENPAFSNNSNSVFVFNNEKKVKWKFLHGLIGGIVIGFIAGGILGASVAKTVVSNHKTSGVEDKTEIEKPNEVDELDESTGNMAEPIIEENTITISKKNLKPYLYDQSGVILTMNTCNYKGGNIQITFNLKNDSQNDIYLLLSDVIVDDSSINPLPNDQPIYPGESWIVCENLLAEDIRHAGVEDFSEIHCNITLLDADKNIIFQQPAILLREAFF